MEKLAGLRLQIAFKKFAQFIFVSPLSVASNLNSISFSLFVKRGNKFLWWLTSLPHRDSVKITESGGLETTLA